MTSLSRRVTSSELKTGEYFVDSLAFNPCPDNKVLVASYGDGELAVFNIDSAELCHRRSNVFAHSLAFSHNGHTLVTGSSQGTILVFEFSGTNADDLALIYRINACEDGIRGLAFSGNSLRFADIRGSQYRVWEPSVLACNDLEEGSLSDMSPSVQLEPKAVHMIESSLEAEITTMCLHPNGEFIFSGKRDGSVSYFDISSATQCGILYRHMSSISVTSISYIDNKSLLLSADECGRVLVYSVLISKDDCTLGPFLSEIKSQEPVVSLLSDFSGTKILVRGRQTAEIWTTSGEKLGASVPLPYDDDQNSVLIVNHPCQVDYLLIITHEELLMHPWDNFVESQRYLSGRVSSSGSIATPPTPQNPCKLFVQQSFELDTLQEFNNFIVKVVVGKGPCHRRSVKSIDVWSVSDSSMLVDSTLRKNITHFEIHANKVRQVIGVHGSMILFLDTDLWVCSLDLKKATSSSDGTRRHFFLLTEWQNSGGGFVIEYVPSTRDFVVARKDSIFVVKKGMEFAESCNGS
jgi:hypothetical protein